MLLKLHTRTLYLLHNRPRTLTYQDIHKKTGLSFHWLKKFAQGKDSNPGVNSVEKLYNFLSGRELDL